MPSEKASLTTSAKTQSQAKGKVEVKTGGGFNLVDGPDAARVRLAAMDNISNASTVELREAVADLGMVLGVQIGGA